jgi:hypothetical protein
VHDQIETAIGELAQIRHISLDGGERQPFSIRHHAILRKLSRRIIKDHYAGS